MNERLNVTKRTRFARTAAAGSTWLVIVGLLIWSISRFALATGSDIGIWTLVLPVFGVVLLALLAIVRVDEARKARIHRDSPDAFVDLVGVSFDTVSQVNAMAAALGVDSLVSAPSIPVLCVTSGSLRLIGGKLFGLGGKPEVLLTMPLSTDAVFSTSRAPQGLYMVNAWHLRQTINGTSYDLDLIPSHAAFGLIPRNYSLGQVRTTAAKMQQIAGASSGV